jgi:hypothetical protein
LEEEENNKMQTKKLLDIICDRMIELENKLKWYTFLRNHIDNSKTEIYRSDILLLIAKWEEKG